MTKNMKLSISFALYFIFVIFILLLWKYQEILYPYLDPNYEKMDTSSQLMFKYKYHDSIQYFLVAIGVLWSIFIVFFLNKLYEQKNSSWSTIETMLSLSIIWILILFLFFWGPGSFLGFFLAPLVATLIGTQVTLTLINKLSKINLKFKDNFLIILVLSISMPIIGFMLEIKNSLGGSMGTSISPKTMFIVIIMAIVWQITLSSYLWWTLKIIPSSKTLQ